MCGLGEIDHRLLTRIDRRALVWRIIAGLGHRPQVRVAQGHVNLPELPVFVAAVRLVGQRVILRSQLLRAPDLRVDIIAVVKELASGLIHKHAKIDVLRKRVLAV